MMLQMLKGKIHRARITNCDIEEAKTHLPDIVVMNEKNDIICRRKGRRIL